MPNYDYLCKNCGHRFELFQPITARPRQKCPRCAKTGLKRLIGSGSGIIFKGSGFYQTDYRSESYKTGEKNEKAGTTKEKTETKDTKPTPKSAAKKEKKPA